MFFAHVVAFLQLTMQFVYSSFLNRCSNVELFLFAKSKICIYLYGIIYRRKK